MRKIDSVLMDKFKNIEKKGDLIIVETSAGLFTYEVTSTRIVDKDDKTVIVPTNQAVLTLTTCYPFEYVGKAPDRYIVSATYKTIITVFDKNY